jgi:hypothetical protein
MTLKDCLYVLLVLRPGRAVDEDVVEENKHEASEEVVEDAVHHRLEHGWCVGEAKLHHKELEVAVMCAERHFGDVVRVHKHLVEPPRRSSLVKKRAPFSSSSNSSTIGIRNVRTVQFNIILSEPPVINIKMRANTRSR